MGPILVIATLNRETRIIGSFGRDESRQAFALAAAAVTHDYAEEVCVALVTDIVDDWHPVMRRAYPTLTRLH